MGACNIAFVHYGTMFGAALEAGLRETGLCIASFNAGFADTLRQLQRAQPAVVIIGESCERVGKTVTVCHLFRLCPGTVVLRVWPDERPIEVYKGSQSRVLHQGDLVELIREVTSSRGEVE